MATSFSTIKNRPGNSSRVIKPVRPTDIGPLTDRVNNIDGLITTLQTSLSGLTTQVQNFNTGNNTGNNTNITNLEDRVGLLENNLTNLTNRVVAIEQLTQHMTFDVVSQQIVINKKVLVNATITSVTPP